MPAVENSLGPCRKPKFTISGWTLVKEYQAYFKFSQRSQAGCIGIQNVKLFLSES